MQEEMLAMIHQSNGEKDENRMLNESFDEDETSSEESVRTKYNLGFVSENPQDVSRGSTVGDENFSDLTEDDDENDMRILAPSFHDRQQIHVHHHHHYHHASNDEAQDTSNVKYNTSNKRKRPLGLKSPPRGREDVLHGAYAPTSTSSAIGGGSGHQDHVEKRISLQTKSAKDFSELFCDYSPRKLVYKADPNQSESSSSPSHSHIIKATKESRKVWLREEL